MAMKLSKQDVERLMKDPSTEARQEVLLKIADQYNAIESGTLSKEETEIVEEIFRALARNAEVEIRKTLAESVKNSPNLPKDIAMSMARDIADIANPILQNSQVFDDKDLLEIMKTTQDAGRALAIAQRDNLSEKLTTELLDKNDEDISSAVLSSFGSNISEASYDKMLGQAVMSERIVNAMVEKGSLSVTITEKLLKRVTGHIRESLDEKYQIIFESKQLKKEMEKNLEIAAATMMGVRAADAHNKKLLEELHNTGKLMPFTALSTGNYQMFEVALSRLAHVPLNNVRILIYDHGETGLKRLCQKAGIPEKLWGVIIIAVKALQTIEAEAAKKQNVSRKPKDLVDRIKLLAGNQEIDHIDFFFSIMKLSNK